MVRIRIRNRNRIKVRTRYLRRLSSPERFQTEMKKAGLLN
jgi:hypothetical protein